MALSPCQPRCAATNTTYEAATNAFNSAEAELKAKQTALEDAEHEYTSVFFLLSLSLSLFLLSSRCYSNESRGVLLLTWAMRRCALAAGQAIGQKDDSIRGAEDAIQKAVEAKSKTADDYATVVRNCAPHVAQGGRQSYHL